jgi:hypothetical protein
MSGGETLVVDAVIAELAPGEGREMFEAIESRPSFAARW